MGANGARSDKQPLLPQQQQRPAPLRARARAPSPSPRSLLTLLAVLLTSACMLFRASAGERLLRYADGVDLIHARAAPFPTVLCPQPDRLPNASDSGVRLPPSDTLAARLAAAVQVPTYVYDDWPSPEQDPARWDAQFAPFRAHLRDTYPRIHAAHGPVTLERVHDHGLLYSWAGTNTQLKPLLLMAHQDVVPVDNTTLDQWLYPPFSGTVDSSRGEPVLFGRGATDAKAWLISILSAVEAMLESHYQPERTVIISFGYDEEASGKYGAAHLAPALSKRYGHHGIAMLVDEGMPVLGPGPLNPLGSTPAAAPALAEKGQMQVSVSVTARGGHSSLPDAHTGISVLGRLITAVEDSPVFTPQVLGTPDDFAYRQLRCVATGPKLPWAIKGLMLELEWALAKGGKHSAALAEGNWVARASGADKSILRRSARVLAAILNVDTAQRASKRVQRARATLARALSADPVLSLSFRTTRAATIIHGGHKVNALPETSEAIFDHRIAPLDSVAGIQRAYQAALAPLACSLSIDLHVFGADFNASACSAVAPALAPTPAIAHVVVKPWQDLAPLSPAPPTPATPSDAPYALLGAAIRSVWDEQAIDLYGANITVMPTVMGGNTDTRWYWDITQHIFRFGPSSIRPDPYESLSPLSGVHTVNEHFVIDGLVKATEFYKTLIVAAGKAPL